MLTPQITHKISSDSIIDIEFRLKDYSYHLEIEKLMPDRFEIRTLKNGKQIPLINRIQYMGADVIVFDIHVFRNTYYGFISTEVIRLCPSGDRPVFEYSWEKGLIMYEINKEPFTTTR